MDDTPTGWNTDRGEIHVLDRSECLNKLASARLGRVGITSGALPLVLPVLFALDGDRILIRCPEDSALKSALDRCVVAFEADSIGLDDSPPRGWSVVATGLARAIAHPPIDDLLPAGPFVPSGSCVVEITTDRISGREVLGPS